MKKRKSLVGMVLGNNKLCELKYEIPVDDGERKFRELILYIASRCEEYKNVGATHLNKILFYSDFYAYVQFGKPITGATYQALEAGPAPRRLVPVRNDLIRAGDAELVGGEEDYDPVRLCARRDPDYSLFAAEELQLVDQIIEKLRHKTAKEISRESHELISWKCTAIGNPIPYQFALISERQLSNADREWASGIIDQLVQSR